jgi:hypothetical protein
MRPIVSFSVRIGYQTVTMDRRRINMDTWILANLRRRDAIRDEINKEREAIAGITAQVDVLEEDRESRFFHIDAPEAEYESLEILPRKKEVGYAVQSS